MLIKSSRVGLFIDGGYLEHIKKYGFTGEIDYKKLVPYVCNPEGILEYGYYYTCMPYQFQSPSENQKRLYSKKRRFIQYLEKLDKMSVKLGILKYQGKGIYIQKRVDVLLALDISRHSWKKEIDTAIIIAGDSDFVPVIEEAKKYGVKTVLYYYSSGNLSELISKVSESHEITLENFQDFANYSKVRI